MFTLPGQAASTTQTPPPPLHAQMAANTRQIATLQVMFGNLQSGHVFVHPDGSKKTKKRIVADLTGVPEDSIIFNRNDGAHSTLNVDIIWCTRQNQVIDNSVNGPPLGGGAGSYNDAWQLDPNGGPPRFHHVGSDTRAGQGINNQRGYYYHMSTGNVHRPVLIMARALKDHPYTFVGIANLEPGTFIRNDGNHVGPKARGGQSVLVHMPTCWLRMQQPVPNHLLI